MNHIPLEIALDLIEGLAVNPSKSLFSRPAVDPFQEVGKSLAIGIREAEHVGECPALSVEDLGAVALIEMRRFVICRYQFPEREPLPVREHTSSLAKRHLLPLRFKGGIELGQTLVQPNGQFRSGVFHQQVNVLVNGRVLGLAARRAHHNQVPLWAGHIESCRCFEGPVGLEFLGGTKADDADRGGRYFAHVAGLEEKVSDLLEIENGSASASLPGVGEKLKVR